MAKSNRELLITLGAETTSFAKQIKRANDLIKELDSNFKLMSSSNKNYENTLKGVGDKQDYLTERIQLFNKKSDTYVKRIKEQQEVLNNVTKDQVLYTRQQDAMSKALKKLEGTKAYETLSKQLEIVEQKLQKANKEVNSHTDSIISLNKQYNDSQREIQLMTNELSELDNKLDNIKSNNTFDKITEDIKESERQFNNIKSSTANFGSTMKDLSTVQNHYQSQLDKSKSLLSEYGKEMEKSSSKIDKMENYVEELTRELASCENELNGMKSTDEGFSRLTTKVESLRVELTGANNILNSHKERLEDVTNKYKATENEVASLSGKVVKAGQDMEKMSNSVSLEKLQREIKYVNDTSLENLSKKLTELKNDFETTSTTTDKYSGSMEGLGNRAKALEEMLTVCRRSTKLYTEQLDALGQESKELTDEIKKVEKSLDYYKKKLDSLENSDEKWDETNNKIKSLNETHKELVTQLTSVEKKTVKSQQGFKSISQETLKLTTSLNKTKEEMKSLDESLVFNKPKEEVKEFTNVVLEQLNQELNETKQQFDKVSNGAKSLDNSMEGLGTKVKFYKTIMEQTNKVIQEYEKETQDIINKNEELTKELNKVQKAIDKIESTRSQNLGTKEWDKQVKKLEKQNQLFTELTTEIEKNNNKINENKNKINSLSNEYQKLEVNVEKTKDKMSSMTESVKIESVKKEISYFNDYTIKKLSQSLDDAKQDFKELSSGVIDLEGDMEGLGLKVDLLEDIINKTNRTMDAYNEQIRVLVSDQKRIKTEIELTEKSLKEYKETLSSLEGTEQWDIQTRKIEELNNKHKELVSELKFVDNKLKSSEQSCNSLNSELLNLSTNVEKTKEKMQQMKDAVNFKAVEKEVKSLSEQAVERLKNDISQLNDSFSTLDKQTSENSNSIHVLTAKSKILNQVLSKNKELEQEYANDLKNTNSEIKRLTSESGRLEQKLRKKEQLLKSDTLSGKTWTKQKAEFDKLSNKYDEVNKELEQLVSKQKQLQSEHKQTSNTIKDLNIQIDGLSHKMNEVGKNDKFKAMKLHMENLAHETEMLSSKMDVLRSKYVNFETSISGAIRESKILKEQTKVLKQEFQAQENAIGEYKTKLQELIAKKTELKQKIEETKNALNGLDTNSPSFGNTLNTLTKLESSLEKVENEVEDVNNELKQMELTSNTTLTSINNNIQGQSRVWETVSGRIKSVGSAFTSAGSAMQSLGGSLMPITAGVTALGGAVIKTGMDFQEGMDKASAVMGATKHDVERLTSTARELASTSRWTATDVADAFGYMGMAGWSVDDALKSVNGSMSAIEGVLELATAGATDLALTSDIVTDGMTAMGMSVENTSVFVDAMSATMVNSNTNIEMMGETLKYAGNVAGSLGITMEDLSLAIGVMANAGIKGSMSGTALRGGLTRLIAPTEKAQSLMEKYGIEVKKTKDGNVDLKATMDNLRKTMGGLDKDTQNMVAKTIFGQTAMNGWLAIINSGQEDYDKLSKSIKDATESNGEFTRRLSYDMNNNLAGDIRTLRSTMEESFLTIFDEISPYLREFTQKLTESIKKVTEWFKDLDDATQKNILKFVALAGVVAPVVSIFGFLLSGIGSAISVFGGLVGISGKVITKFNLLKGSGVTLKGVFTNFGGTMKTVASTMKGNLSGALGSVTKLFGGGAGLSGILGTLTSTVLPAMGLALVGLGVSIGDNEQALTGLIDKFGWFGKALSRISEFLNGAFKGLFGQVGNVFGGIGKTLKAVFSGDFKEIDDIWSETWSSMQMTASESWENITGKSTKAISKLRKYTSSDVAEIKKIFEDTYGQISQTTSTNMETVAENITNMFADSRGKSLSLSSETIDILRGTSDTMRILFAGVKSEMDINEAKEKFTNNLNNLLNTGNTTAEELAKDFETAWSTIDANILDGGQRIQSNASKVLDEFNTVASGKIDQGVDDIVSILDDLDVRGIESLRGIGTNWNAIFAGISTDGKMTVEEMKNAILQRIEDLGLDTPEKLQQFKETLGYELSLIKDQTGEDGEEIGTELLEGVETGVDEGAESTGENVKNTTKDITEKATDGAKEGLQNLPTAVRDELKKAGVTINDEGQVIVEDMGKKGKDAGQAYVDTLQQELPKLSGVSDEIQSTLAGIDSIRLGNVTKQLSEVNKWLGTVGKTSVDTRVKLVTLTNLPFGNTTKGLSEVNQWLMRTQNRAKDTRQPMLNLTNLPFGNTTKGLSEVNNWLMRTTNRAKDTASALRGITSVSFGGVTKGLSAINDWLLKVKNNAGNAKRAVASVSTARPASLDKPMGEPIPYQAVSDGIATLNDWFDFGDISIAKFKTSGGFYEPQSVQTKTSNSKSDSFEIEQLLKATLEQNQLLLQLLNQSKPLEVAVNMDGRQVAKASAKYMESEINLINARKNRLGGK